MINELVPTICLYKHKVQNAIVDLGKAPGAVSDLNYYVGIMDREKKFYC